VRRGAELGLEVGLVGPAHAGPGGIAALRHEAGDDPVEDDSVVKALLGQLPDPGDVARGEVGPEPDDDVAAAVEVEDQGVELVGHAVLLFVSSRR
jgi:hypothetical protein